MKLYLAKLVTAALSNEDVQKGIGWALVAVLSPLILILAALCAVATGGAEHNNNTVNACFYGTEYSEDIPREYRNHISEMQTAFQLLDSGVSNANSQMENGDSLDPMRVKAVFFALCIGEDAPSRRAADMFVDCFFDTEDAVREVETKDEDGKVTTTEETYTLARPVSIETAYANISRLLGREISEDDRDNISHIYTMVAGSMGTDSYDGAYTVSGARSTELDVSGFTDPGTKNAHDLVVYAKQAWASGWGYVWGTFGHVLTEGQLQSKLAQYPESLESSADFILTNWLGGRTTDCVGLIKGYGWLNLETLSIDYGTNGMPDYGANQMYYSASDSGTIDTIPEIPGLAVWKDGHIGVYIGNGEVIEAMGTHYGVVKTQLQGRGWTHWLKIAFINYD